MNIYINATFFGIYFEIFGCAWHSPNKFGSASLAQTFILKRNRPKQLNSKNDCGQFSPGLGKGKIAFLARALRTFFPEKPVNYTLIDLTICFIFSYECIVCASNPSLVTGLSCPCLVLKLVDYFLVKFTVFLQTSYSALLYEAGFKCHYPQDNFYYLQDSFHYPQDIFSCHIR